MPKMLSQIRFTFRDDCWLEISQVEYNVVLQWGSQTPEGTRAIWP